MAVCQGMTDTFQGPSSLLHLLIGGLGWKPKYITGLGERVQKGRRARLWELEKWGGGGKEVSGTIHAGGGLPLWSGSPEPTARMSLLT